MTTERAAPVPGRATELAPGLRRILAPNPGPMTYHGTNTYLLGNRGLAVIDPGPDDDAHLRAILEALEPQQTITHILVTHAHRDHSALAPRLAARTGAPVLAHGGARAGRSTIMAQLAARGLRSGGEGVDSDFLPDAALPDGMTVAGDGWHLTAHWTPGHMGNHMAFAWNGAVFTGDQVMGWSSAIVSPPDGDMHDFLASCEKLADLRADVFHPGHGAPVHDPRARLDTLIGHRRARETAVLDALSDGARTLDEVTARAYADTPTGLFGPASRNALAHLVDLHQRGLVTARPELSDRASFLLSAPPG